MSLCSARLLRTILDIQNQSSSNRIGCFTAGLCTTASGNLYDALGVRKDSTQNDIKTAYYKLSMQFHPDKNQGSEVAVKKFREITRAYEVLGNYKSRRLYDKGIIQGSGYSAAEDTVNNYKGSVEPDIAEAKFYKSRLKKSTISDHLGRTPIYNFDEWSRAHYGSTFQRRQKAKETWAKHERSGNAENIATENEITIAGIFFFLAICWYVMLVADSSYDTPNVSNKKVDGDENS